MGLAMVAALDEHGQHLRAVGQAVFRALAQPAASAPPADPAKAEQNLRLAMLNTLLTTPAVVGFAIE